MSEPGRTLTCDTCSKEIPFSCLADKICPICGPSTMTVHITIEEKVDVYESIKGKVKSAIYTGKAKIRKIFFSGNDLRRRDNKWMEKEQIIDKDLDYYKEIVKDPETGTIEHHCEEKLSEHTGHGSAKPK